MTGERECQTGQPVTKACGPSGSFGLWFGSKIEPSPRGRSAPLTKGLGVQFASASAIDLAPRAKLLQER